MQVKQNVIPLQANEVSTLRRKCQQFEVPRSAPGGSRGSSGTATAQVLWAWKGLGGPRAAAVSLCCSRS
jgi:hypothetical protein